MYRDSEDYLMREALNTRIATVVISILVAAVLGGGIYAIWDSGRDGRTKSQQSRLACVESGGTWVDGTDLEMCLQGGQAVAK